jgi:hypothetical protein
MWSYVKQVSRWYIRVFFLWWRAPQQKLRTHRSLEAYCATLWWRWLVIFRFFPRNGTPVEWNSQGKTEVLGENPVPVPFCPPQIPHGLTQDRNRASAVRGRRLTAWAIARPYKCYVVGTEQRENTISSSSFFQWLGLAVRAGLNVTM